MFRRSFPLQLEGEAAELSPKGPQGAGQERIDALALVTYQPEKPEVSRETSCAVCLADFENQERLCQLPCSHKFHGPCIGKWLARNRRCPLCLHDIELPPPAYHGSC